MTKRKWSLRKSRVGNRSFVRSSLLSIVLGLVAFLFTAHTAADPLNMGIETSASVSHAQDARSVFANPAALGFQTELNGTYLSSAYQLGTNRAYRNDYGGAFAVGYFGAATESLSFTLGVLERYSFALGVPLPLPLPFVAEGSKKAVYAGFRYALYRSAAAVLGSYDSFDFGLQIRPSRFLSVGFLANRLNQPTLNGARLPTQLILGATVRPWEWLDLTIDVDTVSSPFARRVGYVASAGLMLLPGVMLKAGYHDQFRWHGGLEIRFGAATVSTAYQPSPMAPRRFVISLQATSIPAKRALHPPLLYVLKLDEELDEEGYEASWFGRDRPSLTEVLSELEEIRRSPAIETVAVHIERFPLGLAAAQDVSEALLRLRQSGKQVFAFLGSGGIREYLIAAAASRIYVEEAGELKFIGPKSQRYFLKGTLGKIGVEGEFLAKGEYKSAPETFTRTESSPAHRQATLEELSAIESQVIALLKKARSIDKERWDALLEHALFSSEEALSWKLVDGVGSFRSEIDKLKRRRLVLDRVRWKSERLSLPPQIAVLPADGSILNRPIRLLNLAGDRQVTPERFERGLQRALKDSQVKGIIVRVNSPGGEILASHQLASMVERAKKEKPLVVSMGDVAASGGYYLSAPADRIFARELTFTGSIGVFLGKFNLGKLFDKIELKKEILTRNPYPDLDSEDRPWGPKARQLLSRRLDQYYTSFVNYVAARRGLSAERAESAAKGRVWLGSRAKELGLVDALGGPMEAIHAVAEKAGVNPDEVQILSLKAKGGLLDLWGQGDWVRTSRETATFDTLLFRLLGKHAVSELLWMASLRESPFLYWDPRVGHLD